MIRAADTTMKGIDIRRTIIFVLGTYIISTLFSLPLILGSIRSGATYYFLVGLANFGPFFSAAGVTLYFEGIHGIKALFRRLVMWKFSIYLYLIIILLTPVLMISSIFLDTIFIGSFTGAWITIPATLLTVIVAPLGEEIGWRGFFTSKLITYLSPITLSVLLGIIWAGWHLWLFLLPGQFAIHLPFHLFLLSAIADTLWYTWFFMMGRGSAFTGLLFHTSYNFSYRCINLMNGSYLNTYIIMVIIELIGGIVVCFYANKKRNIRR
ncbi:membrane protease YdiL (CAAX protease family) [Paenibacillus sp. DS2015]|uniref:CPBP family intramembrane glutamic endopeptidase n=1 Tax=Paenibacillus sp. DS2015 TaxID=3373917 RepID=UPI003D25A2B4